MSSAAGLPEDDETLVRRFVDYGDESSFEALVNTHLPTLRRLVAAAGPLTPEDREDVLQETLIRVHGALSSFRFDASITTWMFRIARNAALDTHRSRSRRLLREGRTGVYGGISGAVPADPEEQALEHLRAAELKKLFYRLREKDRQLLLLREKEGLSTEDIALVLGLKPGTVKSRLSRARIKARKLFEEAER